MKARVFVLAVVGALKAVALVAVLMLAALRCLSLLF
jgi:hypothetical protein